MTKNPKSICRHKRKKPNNSIFYVGKHTQIDEFI